MSTKRPVAREISREHPHASEPRRKILFLISDTGAGHRSAANAITKAMNALESSSASAPQSPERAKPWQAIIVDVFAECSRFPLRNGVFLYGPVTKYSPRLYGRLFQMTNSPERFQVAHRLILPLLRQGLTELIERVQPDVIVSVHPLLNHPTLLVRRDLGIRIPVLTVVTDLTTIHQSWIARGVDACVVPTEVTRETALGGGIGRRRVHLLGMPIDPAFSSPDDGSRDQRRASLGLDPDLPLALVTGGGEGAGGLAAVARALVEMELPAQLVIITGRNRALYQELLAQQARFRLPVRVEGFVTNMPEWMRAADVLVTKAGPGAITEAMACELPIVLTGAVPGQEEGNIDFVVENGLGFYAPTPNQVIAQLTRLLQTDDTGSNAELEAIRARARRLRHPRASFDIARLILSYLPPPGAPSLWEQRPAAPSRPSRRPRARWQRILAVSSRPMLGGRTRAAGRGPRTAKVSYARPLRPLARRARTLARLRHLMASLGPNNLF